MIVRLNFENTTEAVADIYQTGIFFTGFNEHVWAIFGKGFEPKYGIFIRTMFTPHDGVNSGFGKIGSAAKYLFDLLKFVLT